MNALTENSFYCCDCYIGINYPNQSELLTFDADKLKNFYKIFTDHIFQIIVKSNGVVSRRIGEGFEFYFPKTGDLNNLNSFKEMMECCIALIEKQENLSNEMRLKNLPAISYKVTTDYEKIDLAGDNTILKPSTTAYKIFTLTDPNTNILIIADDIQAILIKFKEFSRYQFNNLGNVSLVDEKPNYDVYSVSRI